MVDIFANKNFKHLDGTRLTNINPIKIKQFSDRFNNGYWLALNSLTGIVEYQLVTKTSTTQTLICWNIKGC